MQKKQQQQQTNKQRNKQTNTQNLIFHYFNKEFILVRLYTTLAQRNHVFTSKG